ncbi:co-chaperone protein p23-1-like isoform X2 [Cucumis melo]|uniref:Co-chaperone protein p23 n=1 Tax=Cucumis melo TaxID=3656 RepID=A0A1S3C553_CUCME|nr:co-chaperone protein p23-1-like isoform X2 [Cucumis melo]
MRHPTLRWAQTSNRLFITIDLPDAQDVKLKLEPEGKFCFSAVSGAEKIPYEVDIDLYDKVDINESKASIGMRNIRYLIEKAEKKWWSRLLKQEGKHPVFVKIDWDKWIDEDEEKGDNSGNDMDFSSLDFSKLGLDPGGGMGADAFGEDDEDDNDINDEGDDKEGEKDDQTLLAGPVNESDSSSRKPDTKA